MESSSLVRFDSEFPYSGQLDIEEGVNNLLPRFRVHCRVFRAIHALISVEQDGGLLGTLAARNLRGAEIDAPPTLYADSLLPIRSTAHGSRRSVMSRLHIPVVKCESVPVPKAMRGGALRWRRLNRDSSFISPSVQLLDGLVALANRVAGSVSLVLSFEAPPFTMWTASALDAPLIADSPLSMALSAATSLRPAETTGYIGHSDSDGRVVKLISSEDSYSDAVGIWALGDSRVAQTAAAWFILRTVSQRNTRIRRYPSANQNYSDVKRDVSFLLAHYSCSRGGPPFIYRCTARVARNTETYAATISNASAAEDVDTLFADFQAVSRIMTDSEHNERNGGHDKSTQDTVERRVSQMDAFRATVDWRSIQRRDSEATMEAGDSVSERALHKPKTLTSGSLNKDETVDSQSITDNRDLGYVHDLSNLPKAISVDFDADDYGVSALLVDSPTHDRRAASHYQQRLDSLARKYLIDL